MALKKIANNQYIKVQVDGTVSIYRVATERDLEKEAPSFTKIITKYKVIIANLKKDIERIYYDPEYASLVKQWETEFEKYRQLHHRGRKAKTFPLMTQYFPNISDSLPELVWEGQVGVSGDTLEEVYESIKRCGFFGEVEDC